MLENPTRFSQAGVRMAVSALTARKTPRQSRARATHDALLEAAAQILSAEGLEGFNTNAVAARAGASIGSLYQYFANKDALMVALIHRQKRRMLDDVAGAMIDCPEDDLEGTVTLLIQAVMMHVREDRLLALAIDHEEARLPVDLIIAEYLQSGESLFMQFFSKCGRTVGIDHARAARTIPVIIQSVMDAWSNTREDKLDIAEQEAISAVLGYLRQQTSRGAGGAALLGASNA